MAPGNTRSPLLAPLPSLQSFRRVAFLLSLAILAVACSESSEVTTPAEPADLSALSILNAGSTDFEGHTPQGFAGSGVGLFVGDNLNANFPDGDGVQLWLTFDITDAADFADGAVTSATVSSNVLSTNGTPFEDLGALRLAPVAFESFSPAVFNLEPVGPATECSRSGETSLSCDATDAVQQAIDMGSNQAQFRMRFDTPGDGDGAQDLAMFFLTDSNTNQAGIFTLELE